jgi:cold shock CspA family protein
VKVTEPTPIRRSTKPRHATEPSKIRDVVLRPKSAPQETDIALDVFVHISAVEKAGLSGLNEGQVVEYEEVADKGKTSAQNLKVKS